MSASDDEARPSAADVPAGRARGGEARTGCGCAGSTGPRVVTRGERTREGDPEAEGIDADTGEPVQLFATGHGIRVLRHLVPDESASPGVALVDALSFTLVPPEAEREPAMWVVEQVRRFIAIDAVVHRKGGAEGFKFAADLGYGLGLLAWGGHSQRGRVMFSLMGKGCSMVLDWPGLAAWLEEQRARITRLDVAFDDIAGVGVGSVAWAVAQYQAGGFNAGGRQPKHEVRGDWLDGDSSRAGRTLYIGTRGSGKLCRIYEKGKQLGDPSSPWVRVEVEWRGKDRLIPPAVLLKPGQYIAGAYPCLRGLNIEQSRIQTVAKGAIVSYEKAVENGKQQCGKLVNLMARVYGGDCGEVVARLQREGLPSRIEPYSYAVDECPERLDGTMPGSFADVLSASLPAGGKG